MDVSKLQSWPGPIARLLNRAQLARDPKVHHDNILFAWEATIRVLVALDPPADRGSLRKPSLGGWLSALPKSTRQACDERLLVMARLLSEEANDAPRSRKGTLAQWLQHLPAYRNRVHGHGPPRSVAFYERAGQILVDGLQACQELGLLWPPEEHMVAVQQIVIDSAGQRRARLLSVMGLAVTLEERAAEVTEEVRSGQLYWALSQGKLRALFPWLLWCEQGEPPMVLFFDDSDRGLAFLDYESRKTIKGKALIEAAPTVVDPTTLLSTAPEQVPPSAAPTTSSAVATAVVPAAQRWWRASFMAWRRVAWLLPLFLLVALWWRSRQLALADWFFRDQRDGWGWSDRCWKYLHEDRLDAAEKACKRGLEVASPDSKARRALRYNLGLIGEKRGDLPTAALWMAQALTVEKHAEIIASLDRVCVRAGAPGRGPEESRERKVMTWPKVDGGTIRQSTSTLSPQVGVLSFGTCVWAEESQKNSTGVWYRIEAPGPGEPLRGWMHGDILAPRN